MEYLEGCTLKEYIKENAENITEDIARGIIKQLLNIHMIYAIGI